MTRWYIPVVHQGVQVKLKAPSYLLKNRHGTFYFRVALPCAIRHHFDGRRELRKSLGTKCPKEAITLARSMRVQLEATLSHAVNKRPSNLTDAGIIPQDWITLKGVKIGDDCSIDEIEGGL